MERQKPRERLPNFSTSKLLHIEQHDTRSITPFHVSVISAIATVIGVDPTEECLELSRYVCIESIDALNHRPGAAYNQHSVVSFVYPHNNRSLLVTARCFGDILIHEITEQDVVKIGKMDSKLT